MYCHVIPYLTINTAVGSTGQSQPVVKNVMTLNTCASIVGAEVMSFDKEDQLLLRWRDLLLESDPDVIIGYNITNFDLPYLYERAQTLGIDKEFHQVRSWQLSCHVTDPSSSILSCHVSGGG